jgi:replicative DNA helicase
MELLLLLLLLLMMKKMVEYLSLDHYYVSQRVWQRLMQRFETMVEMAELANEA